MNNMVIIADDLTGAADTGVQFCPFFQDTILVSYQLLGRIADSAPSSAAWAMAVYTNSRALAADQARQRLDIAAQKISKISGLSIYKKIDSCMRGNVGTETDALLDQLGYEVSFLTPAYPEMGRTTLADVHCVHGIPLDQTEVSQDPVARVTESSLTRIVAKQSRYPVGHISLDFIETTQSRLAEEIDRQLQNGVRHLVFDATNRDHLDRIAQAILSFEHKILPVGSAGLAGSIANLLSAEHTSDAPLKVLTHKGYNLLVCGTASAVTEQQIEKLLAHFAYDFFQLNPAMLADQIRNGEWSKTVTAAQSKLQKNNVILSIGSQPNSCGKIRQLDFQPAADLIVGGLGAFAAEVVAATKPGRLFLSGGDTAAAVLSAIRSKGIRILGEVAAGVVQGVILGGLLDDLPVVTKAGAFGQKDTLVALHKIWQGI